MYHAPVDEIAFTLKQVAGLRAALDGGRFGDLTDDVVDAILTEAGRFASEEIAPLHQAGDRHGAVLDSGAVTAPPGWKELYRRWREGGWNGLSAPEEHGGQGLPLMLGMAALELWNSGSMAFGLAPMLTTGAVEALDTHADERLKALYLPKLVSGEWTGTMNLTEPQAGSDLGALRTRAVPAGDGTYRLFGTKIFITWGEHDLADNIIHLVLARLPDAPAGTRGISMFLVPKFLPDAEGRPGARNDVFCAGIERKLGIHGSPTCTMVYGDGFAGKGEPGAVGWLVGEENRGLTAMFTMMNNARLAVGIQGVAVAETATQKALSFARERRQGRAASFAGEGMAPIVHHPDVQRGLLTMIALTRAARSICYTVAHALDMAATAAPDERSGWQERADLLTPVAKAFSTDVGVDVTSIGIQIHGGMGYVEETGAAALFRDARIAPIYEGTNGIQAIDLVTRKLPRSNGEHVLRYIGELGEVSGALHRSNVAGMRRCAELIDRSVANLMDSTQFLLEAMRTGRQQAALAVATPYLRQFALTAGTAYLARAALADQANGRVPVLGFACENLLGETVALRHSVTEGADSLLAAGTALFAQGASW